LEILLADLTTLLFSFLRPLLLLLPGTAMLHFAILIVTIVILPTFVILIPILIILHKPQQ
jgi:hypothetical protein